MGANDLYNSYIANNYINGIKEYADNNPNSNFIIVSVGPINDELISNHGYASRNENVIAFNKNLVQSVNNSDLKNLFYCDIYNGIIDNYETGDGLHYSAKTYQMIYELISSFLKEL